MKYKLCAPCSFGSESVLRFELGKTGVENIVVKDGMVYFEGDENIIAAANINLRTAERVLILLAEFDAPDFDSLFDGVYSIDWGYFIPADAAFPVKGHCLSSALTSVPACQGIVKKAIVEKLRKQHGVNILPESGRQYKVRFSIMKNKARIMLDTTGEGLHKRGYRRQSGLAPIKETLAATIVDLARIRESSLVTDPFCGSGTLLIEAAQKAMNMAPGLKRRFLAQQYKFISSSAWTQEKEKAMAAIRKDIDFTANGFDIDPMVIDTAKRNADRAGVSKYVRFWQADVKGFSPASGSVVITNPPYGERLGDAARAVQLAGVLGKRLEQNPVKSSYIITADPDFEAHFGKKAAKRRKLYNGMIPCQLYMYY